MFASKERHDSHQNFDTILTSSMHNLLGFSRKELGLISPENEGQE